jgi:hypothetical protein
MKVVNQQFTQDELDTVKGALLHSAVDDGLLNRVIAVLARGHVVIQCEGCEATYSTPTGASGRITARSLPTGWTGTGRSKKHPGRIAEWCPTCTSSRRTATVELAAKDL